MSKEKELENLVLLGAGLLILRAISKPKNEIGGEVSLKIIPIGEVTHHSPAVYGGVRLEATGVATAGDPLPSVTLTIYVNSTQLEPGTWYDKPLNTPIVLGREWWTIGRWTAFAEVILKNPFGSISYISRSVTFDIGSAPAGYVEFREVGIA